MGFFNKLFGNKEKNDNNLSNNRLIRLLDKWGREESEHSFKSVLHELFEGQSFLLVPTVNNNDIEENKWVTMVEGTTLHLTSVTEQDGVKVLAVFSDDTSLIDWAKQVTSYTALKTQDLFNMCRELEIDRVVINSDQKNMFVLERQKNDVDTEEEVLEEETRIRVGVPSNPLSMAIVERINENIKDIPFIDEVYQYIQEDINEQGASEFILMIGVKVSDDSDESRKLMLDTIKQSLTGQKKPELPLGIMVLDNKWYQAMERIGNQPFYVKK